MNENKGETIWKGYTDCDEKIRLYNEGKLQLQPGCDAAQTLEAVITDILNQIRNDTGQVNVPFGWIETNLIFGFINIVLVHRCTILHI